MREAGATKAWIRPGLFHFPWPTRIRIEVLEPIRFERTGEAAASDERYVRACAKRVEDTMQEALDRLVRARESHNRKREGGGWS